MRVVGGLGLAAALAVVTSLSAAQDTPPPAGNQLRRPRPHPRPPGAGIGAVLSAPLPPPSPPPPPPAPPAPAAPPPAPTAAPTAPAPAAVVHHRPRYVPREPPPPKGPVPDVKLTVEASSPKGPWLMRVTNAGEVPVRLVADARLLSFEVTPRSATKALRCQLPPDMRPGDDMQRPLVLPPGKSYAESFEPRIYCFGGKAADALAQGSSVVASLGWTGGSKVRPPFEVGPIDGVEPVVAPVKALQSPPIVLPDETPARIVPPSPASADDPDPPRLSLRSQASIDAAAPHGITMDVTLRNDGSRPVTLRFRPESLRFTVAAPGGVEECGWPRHPVAAMRELYSTVRPGGTARLAVLLEDYCGGHALDAPGLLLITPRLDTTKASGEDIGIRSFDGEVVAARPTVLRLHAGVNPTRFVRPRIEGAQ